MTHVRDIQFPFSKHPTVVREHSVFASDASSTDSDLRNDECLARPLPTVFRHELSSIIASFGRVTDAGHRRFYLEFVGRFSDRESVIGASPADSPVAGQTAAWIINRSVAISACISRQSHRCLLVGGFSSEITQNHAGIAFVLFFTVQCRDAFRRFKKSRRTKVRFI